MAVADAVVGTAGGDGENARYTVAGLFEDTIDAEQAILALRKSGLSAEQVSLLVRHRAAGEGGLAGHQSGVGRVVAATALEAAGAWLHGLASVIVPGRGTFLVAGPLGAALAGISAGDGAESVEAGGLGLLPTLSEFGFQGDLATYMVHRLEAGSIMIAVTTLEADQLQATRRTFADFSAVHIGMALTNDSFASEVDALLAAPPEVSSGGDVLVTDAVAPLRKLCANGVAVDTDLCGTEVVDEHGEPAGSISELLADSVNGSSLTDPGSIRYAVVVFGGLLGLGRRHVAVPAARIDLSATPVRVSVDRDVLHRAPPYLDDAPFSRREEQAISAYFGVTPYWTE